MKILKDNKDNAVKGNEDDFDYLANAASATEFTGLIPSLPQSDDELESYNDVCQFLPRTESAASEKKYRGQNNK